MLAALVQEFQDRGFAHETIASHDIAEIVAIKPAGCCHEDIVFPAGLQFMPL